MFISAKTCDSQLRKKTDIKQLSVATRKYHLIGDLSENLLIGYCPPAGRLIGQDLLSIPWLYPTVKL